MSFRLDSKCPEEISNGRHFTPVICVKGANASGKTQLLKGLSFIGEFCATSFERKPEALIAIAPFFDSKEATDFFVEFASDGVEYRYELSATSAHVKREALYRTKVRKVKLFERIDEKLVHVANTISTLKTINIRKNASVISTAHQYELNTPELMKVYTFFKYIISNVTFSGLRELPLDIRRISKYLHANPEVFHFVKNFIKECDTGIKDIDLVEVVDPDSETSYAPIFVHEHQGTLHPVPAMVESSGTKALYMNLASYYFALKFGGIVIADELDINLHPYLLSKIIDLFLSDETNPLGGQLIFSTHNTEILDHLGRYRTYLVNKQDNESFAYRLDEIPGDMLRNSRPISPAYREGKIGGVPRL